MKMREKEILMSHHCNCSSNRVYEINCSLNLQAVNNPMLTKIHKDHPIKNMWKMNKNILCINSKGLTEMNRIKIRNNFRLLNNK